MGKLICLAIIVTMGLSSCMFVGYAGKRPLYLVGAPDDIKVTRNGKKVDVQEQTLANIVTANYNNGVREKTKYRHPAVLIRVRRNNALQLSSGGKTATLNVKGKAGKGILFLVLEAPITLGIGTLVDLATLSFFYPTSKYIDIDAVFNNTEPKTKKELRNIALENSSKEVTTEIKIK